MDEYDQIPSTSSGNIPEINKSEDLSDKDEYMEEDDDSDSEVSSGQKKKTRRDRLKVQTKLTPQFKGLMGEANLRFARGDIETAEQMCLEVIRQLSDAWEPYFTLAQIYENIDRSKFKGYLTIAGYLSVSNVFIWSRLAEVNLEEGKKKEALTMFGKCLKHDPSNIEIHRKRLALAEEMGDNSMVFKFKETLISRLPPGNHEEIIEVASEIAKIYHKEKKFMKALNALQIPFKKCPKHITPDLVNIFLDLLLITEQYPLCLDVFVDFCNFNFEIILQDDGSIQIKDYSCPDNLSIDFKTKFIVCAIRLKCYSVVGNLIDKLVEDEDVELVGDLYLDICEALMAENKHDVALKLFVPLKKSKNFSLAGVWLKFAECLVACEMKDQAVESYFTVITLAPQHIEVLNPLATLLLDMNRKEEALEVMTYRTADRLNVGVLTMRLKLLKQIGDFNDYFDCMELLLSRHCVVFKSENEIRTLLKIFAASHSEMMDRIKKVREFQNDMSELIPNANILSLMEPSIEDEYQLFREGLQLAWRLGEFSKMRKLSMMGFSSKKFEKYSEEIYYYILLACTRTKDTYNGFTVGRELILKHQYNAILWSILNLSYAYGDQRFGKFVSRQRAKKPGNDACALIDVYADFMSSQYDNALKFFMREFREDLDRSPYLAFALGLTLLQKGQAAKNIEENLRAQLLENATYFFLYYSSARSKMAKNEVYFNLARCYQQLGIFYLAMHYYKKVFEVDNELIEKYSDVLCLKREAAYNLHLIYKHSGNFREANNVLMKYLVI